MDRRQAIKSVVSFTTVALTLPYGFNAIAKQNQTLVQESHFLFLTKKQGQLVAKLADALIPETDTPGAEEALVHHYIDVMLAECSMPDEQQRFISGLNYVEKICYKRFSKSFIKCDRKEQYFVLERLEKEKLEFYFHLKKLTLTGYFTSEVGAKKALRYVPIPGSYQACVTIDSNTKAWFTRW